MKFRNKVLSVLLAAGMVASMPAATAFNVMADDAVAVESTADDSNITGVDVSSVDLLTKTDYTKISFAWGTKTAQIKGEDGKSVDTDQVTVHVTGYKDQTTESLDDKVKVTSADYTVNPTCTTDGKVKFTAALTLPDKDNQDNTVTITSTSPEFTVAAFGHDYNNANGDWNWTKVDGKWNVTYTVTCKRDASHKETYNATVISSRNHPATCTTGTTTDYFAYVTIGDKTYWYNNSSEAVYKTNAAGKLIDKDGKEITEAEKTTKGVIDHYKATGSVTAQPSATDKSDNAALGHEFVEKSWNWDKEITSDYLTPSKEDATKYVDDYMNKDSKKAAAYLVDKKNGEKDPHLTNHYNTSDIKVTVNCTSDHHYEASDGKREQEVPAYVVVKHNPATHTTDASTTYTAYVFGSEAEAKAVGGDNAVKFYNKHQTYRVNKVTTDATEDETGGKTKYDVMPYGSFKSVKTDTWEGTALGHTYSVFGWTWISKGKALSVNLGCTPDNYYVTKTATAKDNGDGTATVSYTATDMRKNPTNIAWYGANGWYLKNDNPYGYTFDFGTFPLENSQGQGAVAMTRLYNPTSGEHLYTADAHEVSVLTSQYNWKNEGIGWYAPRMSNTPVYRLYNNASGEHFYTTNKNEKNTLVKQHNWTDEGIAWYSDDNKATPVYRQFNKNASSSVASHNYTTDVHEKVVLTSQKGWTDEGIAWYGVAE